MPAKSLDQVLAQGGELDPAVKQARLDAILGTGWRQYQTPEGGIKIPVGGPEPLNLQQQDAASPTAEYAPFKRGLYNTAASLLNAGGLGSQLIGSEEFSQALYEKAQDFSTRAEAIPKRVPRIEDAKGIKDYALYGYEAIMENVPLLASLIIPGGATALGARALGASANVAKWAGWTSALVTDVGLQTGESVEIARNAGRDPEDIRVIGSGVGKAFLDFIPVYAVARRLGIGGVLDKHLAATLAEKGFLKRAAGNITTLIATEVPTEVAQESINIALNRSLKDFEGKLTDDEKSQLMNAAAGAVAVSVGFGGAAGIMGGPRVVQPDDPEYQAKDAAQPIALLPAPIRTTASGESRAPTEQERLEFGLTPDVVKAQREHPGFSASYGDFFDPKTGTMTVTGREYTGLLAKAAKELQYDPGLDALVGSDFQPGIQKSRTGWKFDGNGFFSYDQGEAIITVEDGGYRSTLKDGMNLGIFNSPEAAMQEAEKFAYDRETQTGIDTGGNYFYAEQDPERKMALVLRQQPQLTPTEAALVQVEEARPAGKVETFEPMIDESVVVAQLDPGMQKLLEQRMEFVGSKDNYRTADGQMKNAAKATLERIDAKIEALAKKLGIPTPKGRDYETVGESTEEIFQERASETEATAKIYPNLTEAESAHLDALEAKEAEPGRGLSGREYEILERLLAKRSQDIGVPEEEKVRVSVAQAERMMHDVRRRYKKEYKVVNGRAEFSRNIAMSPTLYRTEAEAEGPIPGVAPGTMVKKGEQTVGYILESKEGFRTYLEGSDLEMEEGPFKTQEEAFDAIVEAHLETREDYRRFAQERAVSKPSLPSPERRKLEIEMIKAIRRIYDTLRIKPRVDFAHSDNETLFPKGTSVSQTAKRSKAFIHFKDAGRIFMILDHLESVKDAEATFIHEVLAHFGLRATFTEDQLKTILREVARAREGEIRAHRAEYEMPNLRQTALDTGPPLQPEARDIPSGPITLMQAEEFIASKFEEFYLFGGEKQETFISKLIALFRRWMRQLHLSSWTDKDIAQVYKDVGRTLRKGTSVWNPMGYWWDSNMAVETASKVLGRDVARLAEGDINSVGEVWRSKALLGVLTPLQTAERFNVEGAKPYIEATMKWWARKRTLNNGAVEIIDEWTRMPKKHMLQLANAIYDITEQSDLVKRRLTPEEVQRIFEKNNVSKTGQQLYTKIDQEFRTVLDNLEAGLKRATLRQHARGPTEAEQLYELWKQGSKAPFMEKLQKDFGNLELAARMTDIEGQIKTLRDRNYFPFMRFGEYALTVRAKRDLDFGGTAFKGPQQDQRGQVVRFETFESAKAQSERFAELKREFPSHSFSLHASVLSETEFQFLGMPPALFDLISNNIELDRKQREQLKELFYTHSPGRAFLRHLVKRSGTAGYSRDAMRVFASYMMNSANHIARIEYNAELTDHLSTMRKFAETNGQVAGLVSNYFQKHYDYIMNPKNDWAQIRALGFLWYLGFNVKSALVNLTQIPMVAYPYLASVYGDARATGALANAYKRVVDWRRGKTVLSAEDEAFIKRGIAEGFIDESRATELAGIAEGGVLHDVLPSDRSSQILNRTAYYGSYLFRHAEKFNREVVFLASLELAKQKGLKGEDAFKAARKAVQTTMFEYAKWNRPEFMRGKKSVFFLFWNYMQHLSFLAFGGEGKNMAIRVNLMLLLAAGLQGLPFAENIMDIIDWGGTEIKTALGSKDPRMDLRTDIRELAASLGARPDLVMHGLSKYYGLGALHALELLGVPVPSVDISGSLSAGEPVPGIRELTQESRDPDKKLGATLVAALGPVVGIGYTFWKAMMNNDPDKWKTWERAMPTALKSASQALRRSDRGEETFRGGGAIAQFDPLDAEHRAELIANALGFSPGRISGQYELRSAQEDLKQYWTVRRAMVIENFAWAIYSEDQEAIDDAKRALERFNSEAPSPKLRILAETIRQSLRQRARLRTMREQGLPNEKAFLPLYTSLAQLYGAGDR